MEEDEGEVEIGWLTDETKELFESEMMDKAGIIGWVIEEVGLSAVLEVIDEEETEVGQLCTVDWTLVDRESKVLLTLIDSVEEEVRERQMFSNFIIWVLKGEISEWRVEMDKRFDLIRKGHRKGYLSATVGAMLTHELRPARTAITGNHVTKSYKIYSIINEVIIIQYFLSNIFLEASYFYWVHVCFYYLFTILVVKFYSKWFVCYYNRMDGQLFMLQVEGAILMLSKYYSTIMLILMFLLR